HTSAPWMPSGTPTTPRSSPFPGSRRAISKRCARVCQRRWPPPTELTPDRCYLTGISGWILGTRRAHLASLVVGDARKGLPRCLDLSSETRERSDEEAAGKGRGGGRAGRSLGRHRHGLPHAAGCQERAHDKDELQRGGASG